MSQINPLAFAYAQTPLAERQQAAERDAEIKKTADTLKNAGGTAEEGDVFVESAHAIDPVDDDPPRERDTPGRKAKKHRDNPAEESNDDNPTPHIDVQA